MKKHLNWKRALLLSLYAAVVCFWFMEVKKFELYSKEGYRYNKFNGIYFMCAVLALGCLWDNMRRGVKAAGKRKWVLALGSVCFGLASVMASYPVFEPFGDISNMVSFAGAVLGGFLVGYQILLWGTERLPLRVKPEKRSHGVWIFLLSFGTIAAVYLLYFFWVAYPGYFTRDSFTAVSQCMEGVYDNTSPFWHTMLVKLCMEISSVFGGTGNTVTTLYGVGQCLLMAGVFGYTLVTLYQAGIPQWCIAIVYLVYGFLPYNISFSATLWKDIPFSIATLLTITALYRILGNIGKNQRLNWVLFGIGSLLFCLMRTNGWYAYLVTAAVLLLVLRGSGKPMAVLMCAVLAVGWICNNPVLDFLGVSETDYVEALAIPFQQISRVVADECEIDEGDLEMIDEIFRVEDVKMLYDPLTVDPIKFQAFRHGKRDYLKENMAEYVMLWLRLGAQHPWTYTKAWIDETQGYWNGGYRYWNIPQGGESEALGITRPERENLVKDCFDKWFDFVQGTSVLTQPLYGIGFQVWILFFCLIVDLLNRRREYLLTIPVVVVVLGLWFGTPVFAELRYAYPVFVSVPFLLSITLFGQEKRPGEIRI